MMELLLHNRANNKGQGLVEALVALGVISIVLSAIAIAVISSVNNSDYSTKQNKATSYAQTELETLSQLSKTNWATFNTYDGTYCVGEDGQLGTSQAAICTFPNLDNETLIRQVDFNKNDDSCSPGTGSIKGTSVTVTVKWADGKCGLVNQERSFCHNAQVRSCYTDINTLPTP